MTTPRGVLSAVAAIFVALLAGLVSALWPINNSKATGLAAVAGFLESLFSPLVLDSRCLVFCFVLRGKSAQQSPTESCTHRLRCLCLGADELSKISEVRSAE